MLNDVLKDLFKTYPKQALATGTWFFIIWGVLAIIWRIATATLWGSLILLLVIYASLMRWADPRPLTMGELADWAAKLDPTASSTLLAAILTIVGFLVAFRSAHTTWKLQQLGTLRIAAAEEMHVFFQDVANALVTMELHVEQLLDLKRDISQGKDFEALESSARWLNSQSQNYLEARQTLREKSVHFHGLRAKHDLVVSGKQVARIALSAVTTQMEIVGTAIWVQVPTGSTDEEMTLNWVANCDGVVWHEFISTSMGARYKILGAAGAIRASLFNDVLQPNVSTIKRLHELGKQIPEIVDDFQNKQR